MDGSKYTFEAWSNYEFQLPGQTSNFKRGKSLNPDETCPASKVDKKELAKIRREQKKIGKEYIKRIVDIAKKTFNRQFKLSKNKFKLVEITSKELHSALVKPFPKTTLKYEIETVKMILDGQRLRDIQEYYHEFYIIGKKVNFHFVPPRARLQNAFKFSPELHCMAIIETKEWIDNYDINYLKKLDKVASNDNFKIALNFANGRIYKWLEHGMSSSECAEKLRVTKSRPVISESRNKNSKSRKNIYNNRKLLQMVVDYCFYHSITIETRFLSNSRHLNLTIQK